MMSNKILVIGIFVLLQLFNTLPAQTYEEWIQKSCDCIDKNDWMAAEEALKNAMREEPGNPANFALLCNLGTVQRRQGKKEEAVVSYTAAWEKMIKPLTITMPCWLLNRKIKRLSIAVGCFIWQRSNILRQKRILTRYCR